LSFKKLFIFLLLFILFALPFQINRNVSAQTIGYEQELKAYFDGFINSQMEEYKVPGVTLSVVKDGRILLKEGYGYYDLENNKSVDPDNTLFRVGSTSKLFVWTSIMQLVEQEKISLEDNANQYLDFTIPNNIVDDEREAKPIKIKHLLNHNAGFEDKAVKLFVLSKKDMNPLGDYLKENLPARVYPAGEQMAYSNYATALAAYIVQRVSGMDFAEYVDKNIFEPLNMNKSTFKQPVPEEIEAESSYGYAYIRGEYRKDDFEFVQAYPAGSLSSNAADMSKFMLAHLNNGLYSWNRILETETAQLMHSQSFTHNNDFAGMAHGFIEMNVNGYRVISHGGDTRMFHTGFYLVPELDLGLFVSYNGRDAGRARAKLFKNFMDRYYPSEENIIPTERGENFIDNSRIAGKYHFNRINYTSFESIIRMMSLTNIEVDSENNLTYNFQGEIHPLRQINPGVFYDQESGNKLYAAENSEGEISKLYTNSPNVLLRASIFDTVLFNALFLGGYILLTLIVAFVLIKSLFKKYIRDKFIIEKFTAIITGFVSIGFLVAIIIVFTNNHPIYNIPYVFLRDSSLFNNIQLLIWILPVLAILLVVMNIRVWLKKRWYLLQKGAYTFYTLWSLGIVWWFYHWNILGF
jgi:CubicO group peptidase (beta-lactamase class C family)